MKTPLVTLRCHLQWAIDHDIFYNKEIPTKKCAIIEEKDIDGAIGLICLTCGAESYESYEKSDGRYGVFRGWNNQEIMF